MPNVYCTVPREDIVIVKPGTLVFYEGVGVYLRAALNDPEFGSQPYVSIDTSDLAAEHRYDEKIGLRGDATPYTVDLTTEQPLAIWTISGPDGVAATVHQRVGEWDVDGLKRAEVVAADLNDEWRKTVGMPIISVHLNDGAEVYDDQGQGNTAHLTEQVVEKLRRARSLADSMQSLDEAYGALLEAVDAILAPSAAGV